MALVLNLGGVGKYVTVIWVLSGHSQESGDLDTHPTSPANTVSKPTHTPTLPTNIARFFTKGWMSITVQPDALFKATLTKSLVMKTTNSRMSSSFAPMLFPLLPSPVPSTMQPTPLGSIKLDGKYGHNCKMSQALYTFFCSLVLGLSHNSSAASHTKQAFCNMILKDIDALMHYYNTDTSINSHPVLYCGDLTNMACILAQLALLLVGTNAFTPNIIN
jgi:hypothetical protein